MAGNSDSDETLGFKTVGAPESSADYDFPANWDRYENCGFLGEGGMGRVYKALDRSLKRYVALKIIRYQDPALVRRFLQEASSQAQIDHENVCKVFEVGVIGGKHFIAMQFIAGETFDDASLNMTLDQKVKAMTDISEAIHAAHQEGLIHRDIKPGNIMLEQHEGNRWKPYILDFGLARDQEAPGMTVTGMIMGTPHFMSPEQARGEVHRLDRRTDVYSLGATLYCILTGQPPFGNIGSSETLGLLMHAEAPPLRSIRSSIPVDVETIVMKCLEKDPDRRYPSARALADDLDRYLKGEPITVRPASLIYRLGKKAKKNKPAVAVGLAALVLLVSLVGYGFYLRHIENLQAEMASAFRQDLEVMEDILQHAHTSPLHDIRKEKQRAYARVKKMEDALAQKGKWAAGPGNYALGRAFLSLRETDRAREHLDRAWNSGYQSREVAYALGQAFGTLYQQGLHDLERTPDPEIREAKRRELEEKYKTPALRFLENATGTEVESVPLLEAQIAFYEKRFEEALEKARQSYQEKGWIYSARLLEGDIRMHQASESFNLGNYTAALALFQLAEQAYRVAQETARSDPSTYASLCRVKLSVVALSLQTASKDYRAERDEGIRACERAIVADPEMPETFRLISEFHWRIGEYEWLLGSDPRVSLKESVDAAERALSLNNRDAVASNSIGISNRILARFEIANGLDPEATLRRAIEACSRAQRLDPGYAYAYNTMGGVYRILAESERVKRQDPRPSLQKAVDAYRNALRINPRFLAASNNMGGAYSYQADYEMNHGMDPTSTFDKARSASMSVLKLNPNFFHAHLYIGESHRWQASYEVLVKRDPRNSLERSRESFLEALRSKPGDALVQTKLALASIALASWKREQAQSLDPEVGMARQLLEKATAAGLEHRDLIQALGDLALLEGETQKAAGGSPEVFWRKAREFYTRKIPADSLMCQRLAELHFRRIEWLTKRKSPVTSEAQEAIRSIDRCIENHQDDAELAAWKGVFLMNLNRKEEAAILLNDAISRNANLSHRFQSYLASP